MNEDQFNDAAAKVLRQLPAGNRLGIIGSADFWNPTSQSLCEKLGELLAALPNLVLLTGGVPGVGEIVARRFQSVVQKEGNPAHVFHILPYGFSPSTDGVTLTAGANMFERREILARLAPVYIAVEGGPGTAHEGTVAQACGALVIPIGRNGGYSGKLYESIARPSCASHQTWALLGDTTAEPATSAAAAVEIASTKLGMV